MRAHVSAGHDNSHAKRLLALMPKTPPTRCTCYQVVYDLLDPNNRKRKGAGLEIREHGVLGIYVKGLQVRRREALPPRVRRFRR